MTRTRFALLGLLAWQILAGRSYIHAWQNDPALWTWAHQMEPTKDLPIRQLEKVTR